jgi:curved DNA-binding protein CbpA
MGELGARVSVGWQRGTKTSRLHNQGHVFFILHGGGCMHGFTVSVFARVTRRTSSRGAQLMDDTYYVELGVSRDTSEADIKKAYHKLAIKWHPDKNPEFKSVAEAKFKSVAEAYEVLSDPEKRAAYDRHGKDGVPSDGRAAAGGFRTGGVHSFADADEIFQRFFGGRDPFAAFLGDDADSPFGRSPFGSVLGGSSVGGLGAGSGGRSNLLGSLHNEFLAGGCGGASFSQTQTTQTQTQFSSFSSSTSKSTFGGMGGSCTSSSQSISTSVENGVRVTRKMTTKTTADGQTTTSVEESRTTPDGRTETRTV